VRKSHQRYQRAVFQTHRITEKSKSCAHSPCLLRDGMQLSGKEGQSLKDRYVVALQNFYYLKKLS
jgi:hypothetical protein